MRDEDAARREGVPLDVRAGQQLPLQLHRERAAYLDDPHRHDEFDTLAAYYRFEPLALDLFGRDCAAAQRRDKCEADKPVARENQTK